MFKSLVTFWLAYSGLFAVVTICSFCNRALRKNIDILLPWIKEILHPALVNNAKPVMAREMVKDRIPTLEAWDKAAVWYDVITYVLMMCLTLLGLLVSYSIGIPYILLMVIAMLLGSMVMFFPRTLIRRYRVRKAIGHYFLAYAGMIATKIKETSTNGSISDGGTNSHS